MTKSELQSKHLSELHALAAEAGVERYRMLSRDELIEKLADGSSGGGGGSSSSGSRGGGSRGGRERQSGGRQGGGRDRGGRDGGGRDRNRGGREGARDRDRGSRGGERERGGRGGDRQRSGRGGDREREQPQEREQSPRAEPAPMKPRDEGSGEKPKRRRRRRFRRRGGKTVRAHEMLMPAAGARQALVYAETRAGATAILRELAAELSGGKGPDPVALLVDPSPEELADWKREAPKAEIVSAGQERHAEDALAQAVRRAESGEAVVFLVDSLTRIGEEFGGSKSAKELFDGGLAAGAGSGSLTVIAAIERPAD